MTPTEIIAKEVGPLKAHTILAALRAQGWDVVRRADTAVDIARRLAARPVSEIQAAQAFPY